MPTRYFFPFVFFRIIAPPPFSAAMRERKCDKKKLVMLVIGRKRNLHASDVVYTDLCTVSVCVVVSISVCVPPVHCVGPHEFRGGIACSFVAFISYVSFSFFPPWEEVVL